MPINYNRGIVQALQKDMMLGKKNRIFVLQCNKCSQVFIWKEAKFLEGLLCTNAACKGALEIQGKVFSMQDALQRLVPDEENAAAALQEAREIEAAEYFERLEKEST